MEGSQEIPRTTLGSEVTSNNWKPFKNDEQCFLFYCKRCFRSWDIYIFVLSFWLRKKRLDKKGNFKIYDVTDLNILGQEKQTLKPFRLLIQRYVQSWSFIKESWTSFTIFCIWFFQEKFLMLHSIDWPNFTVCLPSLLAILDNMCIVIICCPVCDIINFEINHSFLIKALLCRTWTQDKNVNISRRKKAFSIS